MISTKLFPAVLIVLDVLAAVVYLCAKDVRQAIYWLAAATLTLMVTI